MKKFFLVLIAGMVLFNAGFGVFLRPLLYTLTPLQRHYLGAYLWSSWKGSDPAATTTVRWVWKVKPDTGTQGKTGARKGLPKLQYALATEDDLVPLGSTDLLWKGDRLPFLMSRKAELEGWSGVVWLTPVPVNSAQLAGWLRHDFFAGEPAWRFFVQPVLLFVLCVALWFTASAWLVARRQGNLWRTPPSFWQKLRPAAGVKVPATVPRVRPTLPRVVPRPTASPSRTQPSPAPPKPAPVARPTQPATPPAARPVLQTTLWDESKGLE